MVTKSNRSVSIERCPNYAADEIKAETWVDRETVDGAFKDERLGRRFRTLLSDVGGAIGASLPLACQDWANTKAAYRFLSNERVDEADILSGHFAPTAKRFAATDGMILVLQDTTEFSFKRERPEEIGFTKSVRTRDTKEGRKRVHSVCGILMHSSLAVTTDGLPLGVAAIKFWNRKKFKGARALKTKINPTRVPIEKKESVRWLQNLEQSTALLAVPERCVHVGDRESDIYELYCKARELGTHFVVRTCVDRLAGDGEHTIADEMDEVAVKGIHAIETRDEHGEVCRATLELKYRRIRVLPPIGKQKQYPELDLTVIHAVERGAPKGRKSIEWKLITTLPVRSRAEAIEKLDLVRDALEDRGVPQDPQVRLQGGRVEAQNCGSSGQSDRALLHPQLARLLAHDAEPDDAGRRPRNSADRDRGPRARSPHPRSGRRTTATTNAIALSDEARTPRRLSRQGQRSATREHRHVARPRPPHRHSDRRRNRCRGCG